jgi:L-ascorbate metabolism protein UlaG (beta-lactamase superfamily)
MAQTPSEFTGIQRLTNRETLLRLSGATGVSYRIDASTNLPGDWNSLLTLFSTGVNQYIDSATPFLKARYYRAEQLTGTNHLTGEHLVTTNGDVVFHPLFHATFLMIWNGKAIYNDPANDSQFVSRYLGLPKADLILISHHHGDHYSSTRIAALGGSNAVIIVPQKVYDQSSFVPFRTNAVVLNYGMSTNVLGLTVEAVPGYNSNHLYTTNNAYITTIGSRRIFTTGDTGDVAEIRALTNIDVAFVCMNLPFTMTVDAAASTVRQFRPRVVYPYHYIPSTPPSDLNRFKQLVGTDLGIEVRLRNWY